MSVRILTLAQGDAWVYYALCDDCGRQWPPTSSPNEVTDLSERHQCPGGGE